MQNKKRFSQSNIMKICFLKREICLQFRVNWYYIITIYDWYIFRYSSHYISHHISITKRKLKKLIMRLLKSDMESFEQRWQGKFVYEETDLLITQWGIFISILVLKIWKFIGEIIYDRTLCFLIHLFSEISLKFLQSNYFVLLMFRQKLTEKK